MEEALGFFRAFEAWIYLLLGLVGLFYVRKFYLAWQELQGSGFGLERENAQARLNQAASVLVLFLTVAVTEFVLVSYIAPAVPEATPLLTPTLNLLTTPTATLSVEALDASTPAVVSGTVGAAVLSTSISNTGCISGEIQILSPHDGQEVGGVVAISGTVSIKNFGFYKLEMKRPDETVWSTLSAGNAMTQTGRLGDWDTRRLNPADYQLSLVVVDNQARASLPCIVQVRVTHIPDVTPSP